LVIFIDRLDSLTNKNSTMEPILSQLAEAVEAGKVDKKSPFPPQMKDQDGADELAKQALDIGVSPRRGAFRCAGSCHGPSGTEIL
jgi:hypothetical protein